MASKKLELKIKSGSFELWAQGENRAFVMVANGDVDQPHRVAVEIYSAAGMNATRGAHKVFNDTVAAFAAATH